MLMFFCIGMSQAHAQNYKPFDEATAAVKVELDALSHEMDSKSYSLSTVPTATSGAQNVSKPAVASDAKLKIFKLNYLNTFINQAKETGDIATAMQNMDNMTNTQGQPQSRVQLVTAARADLMELITQ